MGKLIQQPNMGLLIFRVVVFGLMLSLHGMAKMPPGEQLIEGVQMLGFPAPLVFAWLAALSEVVCAGLIVLGLYTRIASAFLGFTMAVAAFVAHGADPLQKKELALIYLASCVLLMLSGAGSWSLDKLIRKK